MKLEMIMPHKKQSARVHASQRVVVGEHLSQTPAVPASQKKISQGRFPGETPLTGEDRPPDQAGDKRDWRDPAAPAEHAVLGHPRARSQGPSTMPRPQSKAPTRGRKRGLPK
jgi:hypothetical protein